MYMIVEHTNVLPCGEMIKYLLTQSFPHHYSELACSTRSRVLFLPGSFLLGLLLFLFPLMAELAVSLGGRSAAVSSLSTDSSLSVAGGSQINSQETTPFTVFLRMAEKTCTHTHTKESKF